MKVPLSSILAMALFLSTITFASAQADNSSIGYVSQSNATSQGNTTSQSNATSQGNTTANLPSFVKDDAAKWSNDTIAKSDFSSDIQYMVDQKVVKSPKINGTVSSESIPGWMKNMAKWYADGEISSSDLVSAIQFLVDENIIKTKD